MNVVYISYPHLWTMSFVPADESTALQRWGMNSGSCTWRPKVYTLVTSWEEYKTKLPHPTAVKQQKSWFQVIPILPRAFAVPNSLSEIPIIVSLKTKQVGFFFFCILRSCSWRPPFYLLSALSLFSIFSIWFAMGTYLRQFILILNVIRFWDSWKDQIIVEDGNINVDLKRIWIGATSMRQSKSFWVEPSLQRPLMSKHAAWFFFCLWRWYCHWYKVQILF